MEVGSHSRNTNLFLVAVLTLVLLGLGLSFLTWQNLRQQRETLNKHMLLSAQGILRGVEAGLIRDMRVAFRGGRRARDAQPQLKTRAEELFKELASSGGVEFLALYGPDRKPAVTSWNPGDGDAFSLPDQAWESLSAHGKWIKLFRKKKNEILVAAVRSHPLLTALCNHDSGFRPPPQTRESSYLVVGIDTREHLALYRNSRQAAFLQTGYVLLVAVFLWGLALGYLRRREQGKALQEDLAEAKKIGRLAAGLAHEIRNPLSAIRGFAQYFTNKFQGRDPEEKYAQTMVREADRLDRVVTDLLFLANPRAPQKRDLELAGLIQDLQRLLSLDLTHKKTEFTYDLQVPRLFADPDMLKQILLNLLMNSLAVLPEQGGAVHIHSFKEGTNPCLAVKDNGPGMTSDQKAHALEMFFTTREQGTGLGLAIVHKIMRDHHGRVAIISEPGQGTEIRLIFPKWRGK